jgi:CheY-like chemotaxis protein
MIAILSGEVQRFSSKSVQIAQRVQRPKHRTRCKVLVVEDNPINQQVAAELLKKMGCEVSLAENGQVALECCQENDFDLIFMDMQMPVMDGLQATKALRNLDQTRHIPIIAMTANVMKGDKERCLQAGMNDYIGKPVGKEEIRNKLEQWLGIKILDNSSGKNRRSNLEIGMEKLQIFEDPELAKEIIELFVDNHGNDALQLKKLALKDHDYISLLKVAHKLKGSAAELNLPELSQLCENIRIACNANDFAEVERIVNKIETELANSIQKLKQYVATLAKQ